MGENQFFIMTKRKSVKIAILGLDHRHVSDKNIYEKSSIQERQAHFSEKMSASS